MDHLDHQREVMKLKYAPFSFPAITWHCREGNRKVNERFAREGYPGRDTGYDPIMSDA